MTQDTQSQTGDEAPFIIWTLRRTGGTTFTNLLMELSAFPSVEHEPFNWDRAFGPITRQYKETGDVETLDKALGEALADRVTIKHCFDVIGETISQRLWAMGERLGYRHIFLDRRDEMGRLLSLELARMTGVWGKHGSEGVYERIGKGEIALPPIDIKALVDHGRECAARRKAIASMLERSKIAPRFVMYEDLYADRESGSRLVNEVAAWLSIPQERLAAQQERIAGDLTHKRQFSEKLYPHIPNLAEAQTALREALQEAPPLKQAG